MPSAIDIPQRFTTDDPAQLKRELERMAQALDLFTRQGFEIYAPRYTALPTLNPTALVVGRVARVNLVDGDLLRMQMPPANRKDFGKKCAILRETTTGNCLLFGGAALVGGADRYQLANDIHFVEFLLDDGDWYPSRAGGGWAP